MENKEEQILFYQLLKESRMSREINLDTISDELKINIKYLKAIEDGNLNIVPNTYIRLFIRSYAEYLKLDSKEILNQFENKNIPKRKNIFGNSTKKNIKKDSKETRKIYSRNNDLKISNVINQNLTFDEKNKIDNKKNTFNINEAYFLKPKKIISSISITILILSIYLLISYISNQQKNSILNDNNTNNTSTLNNEENQSVDNRTLSSIDFNQNKLVKQKSYKLRHNIESPYKFQIITKEKTKLYISYDENGLRKEECNIIAKKDTLIKLTKHENIYFDLWNAKHVEIAIDNKSITKYLEKNNYIVRGSFKPTDKLLYLEFYNY